MCAFRKAYEKEESKLGKETIKILIDNGEYAKKEQLACCHDTGTCIVIMEIGQEVCWEGFSLQQQVNQGVRQGYEKGYLRKSMVADPSIVSILMIILRQYYILKLLRVIA